MNLRKTLFGAIAALAAVCLTASCNKDDDTWDNYKEWRETNDAFYDSQSVLKNTDGTPFYTKLAPQWYPTSRVLIHYFNDRALTAGNLTPLVTSTVSVKYRGWLCNDVAFDSSYTSTVFGDSIARFVPANTIAGWQIALTNMRVGDSVRVVIPWAEGYGASTSNSTIPPFSTLMFDIKLVDIPALNIDGAS